MKELDDIKSIEEDGRREHIMPHCFGTITIVEIRGHPVIHELKTVENQTLHIYVLEGQGYVEIIEVDSSRKILRLTPWKGVLFEPGDSYRLKPDPFMLLYKIRTPVNPETKE